MTPEAQARQQIDAHLIAAGWAFQDRARMNLTAAPSVAVREYPTSTGPVDYLLYVGNTAVGVIEAKPAVGTLSGVAEQSKRYLTSTPKHLSTAQAPLVFGYESTGVETYFRDRRDLHARSRPVFAFHQPATLKTWLAGPDTLRARPQVHLPRPQAKRGGPDPAFLLIP